jgi:hypothetical protein
LGFGELEGENHRALSVAAFTTHVLKALVESFFSRVTPLRRPMSFRRAKISSSEEVDLVRAISDVWRIRPSIPSLIALKQALSARLVEIGALAGRGALLEQKEFARQLSENEFIHLNLVQAIAAGIDIFNDGIDEPSAKWALLFDEIEIAPQWIQDELMRSFRSVDQRILIKLAISPVSSCARLLSSTELSPAGREDIREVQLWHPEKQGAYKFCRDLWGSLIRKRKVLSRDPQVVLGPSYFDPDEDDVLGRGTAYRQSGSWAQRFSGLAGKDASFRRYLSRHSIDPNAIGETSVELRDRTIRKIAPLVAVRDYFRSADGSTQQTRSRKAETIYAGADSLFAITEGNPRWFIGITNPLLAGLGADSPKISPAQQAAEIESASNRFLSMLRTIPVPNKTPGLSDSPLTDLLERIGDYFFCRIVVDDFAPDPPLCFTVDKEIPGSIESLLEIALNRGAIVYVTEAGDKPALPSVSGRKFRLCYLLAANFGLPLRLGKDVSLSTILDRDPLSGRLF